MKKFPNMNNFPEQNPEVEEDFLKQAKSMH